MKTILDFLGITNFFNWLSRLILDEVSKLPSSRKVIAFIFTIMASGIIYFKVWFVKELLKGLWAIDSNKLIALDSLTILIYICCGMILLLLAVVTMQQIINFRTSSKYNSAPGEMPSDLPAVSIPDPSKPQMDPAPNADNNPQP